MKPLFALVGMIAITSLGSGCGGLAKTARALSKDEAIVIVEVNTPYGKQKLTRIGGTSNSVEVSTDGTVVINPKK